MTRPSAPSATPWATGLALTAFALVATVVTVVAFGSVLTRVSPALALGVNVVAGAGVAPTLWVWSRVPLWRWVAVGVAAGVPVGWLMLLVALL
ncbi:DUF2537 domain-containing protein [Rhodococcus phenolicus]|uniref:DUF2537 domain-containing protein n=1 Tax=Rhodococcus phenolicus TaxID=263849 RepID=UPI00082F0E7E|nr:DUF2537 domain-containing protein [Rhodococcus phenolicus]